MWRIGYVLDDYWGSAHVTRNGDRTPCGKTLCVSAAYVTIACRACRAMLDDVREPFEVLVDLEGMAHGTIPVVRVTSGDRPRVERWRWVKCLEETTRMVAESWGCASSEKRVNCLACLGAKETHE